VFETAAESSDLSPQQMRDLDELRAALKPSPKARAFSRAKREAKKTKAQGKKEKRQSVRAAVFERAGGECECGCGRVFGPADPGELDHFFGKAREESVESCWALTRWCHHQKTVNAPSAAEWLARFAGHCAKYLYWDTWRHAKSRLQFVETRAELGGGR
jgi:hypothetical protein